MSTIIQRLRAHILSTRQTDPALIASALSLPESTIIAILNTDLGRMLLAQVR